MEKYSLTKGKKLVIFPAIGAAAIIVALALSLGVIPSSLANNYVAQDVASSDSSNKGSTEAASFTEVPLPNAVSDDTKFFLIGYPLATQPETAHKVKIDEYPWLGGIVRNGETIVSIDQTKQFLSTSKENLFYAVQLDDGTTKYYEINYYQMNLIPKTSYVKAYWTQDSAGKTFEPMKAADLANNTWLKKAVESKSVWIPMENPEDAAALKQFLDSAKTKNIAIESTDNGGTTLFNIRYIDANQETVS